MGFGDKLSGQLNIVEHAVRTAALGVFGLFGILPWQNTIISLALCGATIGFAFFNRPVAKIFLGDVGSLPIGLLLGWQLLVLAASGGRAAAALLPLYYLADSSAAGAVYSRTPNSQIPRSA